VLVSQKAVRSAYSLSSDSAGIYHFLFAEPIDREIVNDTPIIGAKGEALLGREVFNRAVKHRRRTQRRRPDAGKVVNTNSRNYSFNYSV